jgi:hypothetical protein
MITTVISVLAFIAVIGGTLTVSVLIAIAILHVLDKSLDSVSRLAHPSSSPTSNPIKDVRGHGDYGTSHSEVLVNSHISPQKVTQTLITRRGNNVVKKTLTETRSPCQDSDTQRSNENYSGYPKYLIPVKHIRAIVSKLILACQPKWKRTSSLTLRNRLRNEIATPRQVGARNDTRLEQESTGTIPIPDLIGDQSGLLQIRHYVP